MESLFMTEGVCVSKFIVRKFIALLMLTVLTPCFAMAKTRIGFVSLNSDEIAIREFDGHQLFKKDLKLSIDAGINSSNYTAVKKLLNNPDIELVDMNNISSDDKKILSGIEVYDERCRDLIVGLGKKYSVSKLVLIVDEVILKNYKYYHHNGVIGWYRDEGFNIKGRGFYVLSGSLTNTKLNTDRLLYVFSTAKMFLSDASTGMVQYKRNIPATKNIHLKKDFDSVYHEKLFHYSSNGINSKKILNRLRKAIFSDKIDKKEIRKIYARENEELDEYDDALDELEKMLSDEYLHQSNFTTLTKNTKKHMKEYLDEVHNHVLQRVAAELKMKLVTNNRNNTEILSNAR